MCVGRRTSLRIECRKTFRWRVRSRTIAGACGPQTVFDARLSHAPSSASAACTHSYGTHFAEMAAWETLYIASI
jgi:hypothetical protein